MIDPKRLAVYLLAYEADEPHVPEEMEDGYYPVEPWSAIEEWLGLPHDGDCVGAAQPCRRCYAEHIWHKAQWIAGKMNDECST